MTLDDLIMCYRSQIELGPFPTQNFYQQSENSRFEEEHAEKKKVEVLTHRGYDDSLPLDQS